MSASRYAILGRLATGGMAELFLARAEGGSEIVVVKRVKPRRLVDPQFARMFLDEARLAAQLHHDNIARVLDIGRLGESYFFTMEYIHGDDVRAILSRLAGNKQFLPIGHALLIARSVAAGLHYAHERTAADGQPLGIVHRDVSPSNVMVGFDGAVKLVDFGVAKAAHRTVKTQAGAVKGKVTYFSPEQCRGRPVDRRSDVFSLGILVHEMLTGARLFKRVTDYHTMQAILTEDVPPPSRRRVTVTPALDRVVMTALARDPAARYTTAGEMAAALDDVAARERWVMSPAALGSFVRDLFGARPEPWLAPAVLDAEASVVSVISVLVDADLLALGTEPPADTDVEAQLQSSVPLRPDAAVERGPDDPTAETTLSAPRPGEVADDEWRDEVVALGEPRSIPGTVDAAAAIAAVRAAAAARAARDGFDVVDDGATVAMPPPSWVLADHPGAAVVPAGAVVLAPAPAPATRWLFGLIVAAAAFALGAVVAVAT